MAGSSPLPDELEACHALIEQLNETNGSLATTVDHLKEEVALLKRYIYGQRSERHVEDEAQLKLFDKASETPCETPVEEVLEEEIAYRRRRRKPAGTSFPEHLERKVRTVDVPEAERCCGQCGDKMSIIGKDVRERLEFVPAKLFVQQTRYPKRACSRCKTGVTSAPPQDDQGGPAGPVAGGIYGFGVYAQVVTSKCVDHLPLYRQQDILARAGVVLSRSTLCDIMSASATILTPLVALIKARLLASGILGADDTPVRLQDHSLPGRMRTARFWLYHGHDATAPYNVFDFHESRSRDGPATFLKDYHGLVTVDAYGVGDGVYLGATDRILASCCNAHARRKFVDARSNDPARASRALSIYQRLYDIEDRGRELSVAERLELRQRESAPLMNELKAWLEVQAADSNVLPKSAIGKAVRYALNQWEPLCRFLGDGSLPIDNNDTERELRRMTIGRKNWLFIGAPQAGDVAAKLYTVAASAARHDLDVWAYLDDALRKLSGSGEVDLESLLPDRWKAAHPSSIRTYRQAERESRAARTKQRRARRRTLENRLGRK